MRRVHILNGSLEGDILKEIFSNRGSGTMIYANQHGNIRPMTASDIPEVLRVMQPFVERGALMARREEDLLEHCEDFAVYDVDGLVHACGALYRYPENQGEIAGIAVDETYTGMGIGKKIVSYLLNRACSLKLDRVFALTTQTGDWFQQLGFRKAEVGDLPALRRQR